MPDVSPTFTPRELQGDFSQSATDANGNPAPDPGVAGFLQANPFFQADPAKQAQAIIDQTKINSISQAYINNGFIPTSPNGVFSTSLDQIYSADELTSKFDFNLSS